MKNILCLLSILAVTGCVGHSSRPSNLPFNYQETLSQKLKNSNKASSSHQAKQKLLSQYKNWKGTPYQYGGLSKKGIDCSGFVQVTFKNKFGRHLPRTAEQQANLGTTISKSQLQAGDLVFFETSYDKFHVGMALGNAEFMHASTSKGVIISNLDNAYWSKYYKFSIRL